MTVNDNQGNIIIDGASLSTDAIPGRLVGRQEQAGQLRACLAPMLRGLPPMNAWLHGPPGSGKTLLAKSTTDEVCASGANRLAVYVNCWQHRTLYGVSQAIINELRILGAEAQDTNVKLDRIRQFLRDRPTVIILDEIDRPMPAAREIIIRALIGLPKTGVICVAGSTNALAAMDERTRSRLSPALIEAPAYSTVELEAILADRAHQSLSPGSWSPATIRHIALSSSGDTRVAINALRRAAAEAEQTVRRVAKLFRYYVPAGQSKPMFRKLWVSMAVREPDFSDDYRRLYDLECELSDGKPWRYELLSVWRLARDPQYAAWAKSVGPDTCQITFFGEQETTDWFCRRPGAFAEAITATEQLLEAGMKPRWQLFANTRGIGEFDSLLRRVDAMRIRPRVEQLGSQFDVFAHAWAPNGRSLPIEPLRPTEQDMRAMSADLLASSRRYFGCDVPWLTEASLYEEIMSRPAWHPYALDPGHMPWFIITGNLDVYFNACGLDPWWRLGNIWREDVSTVVSRLVNHDTPGLRTGYTMPPQELARAHGREDGRQVFSDADSLLALYLAKRFTAHSCSVPCSTRPRQWE